MGTQKELFATIAKAVEMGLSAWPPRQDGSKAPFGDGWKERQHKPATFDELRKLYKDSNLTGIGVMTGKVSGNLECLDFDERGIYDAFKDAAIKTGLQPLLARLEIGYKEHSPNGAHILYRCDEISGSTKLATRPKCPEEMKDEKDKTKTLIETRGEGAFAIIAPTFGTVNPAGNYDLISGSIATISTITPEERRELFSLARTFHIDPAEKITSEVERLRRESSKAGGRPGDEFNERATWPDVLEPHGWKIVFSRGDVSYWWRPGKSIGISATIGHNGADLFHCFTSSSVFEPGRSYTKFTAYAVLNHHGDFSAAARELAGQGYGDKSTDHQVQAGESPGHISAKKIDIYSVMKSMQSIGESDIQIEWLIDGLIPKDMITMLTAREGVGKSTLASQMGAAVSEELPFMGRRTKKAEVVYIDYENPESTIAERARKVCGGEAPFVCWYGRCKIDPPKFDRRDKDLLKQIKPGSLIIIDTLKASNDANENAAHEMQPIMDHIKALRNEDHTIIVLHHAPKGNDRGDRGSTAIPGATDHNLNFFKVKAAGQDGEADDDEDSNVYCLRSRKTRARPVTVYLTFDAESETFKEVENPENEQYKEMLGILNTLHSKGTVNQSAFVEAARHELPSIGKNKIHRIADIADAMKEYNELVDRFYKSYEHLMAPRQYRLAKEDFEYFMRLLDLAIAYFKNTGPAQ